MTTLYHYPLCPFSRKVRLILGEQKIGLDLIVERYWENRKEFIKLNPSGEVPVLLFDEVTFCGHYSITEYVEYKYEDVLPNDSELWKTIGITLWQKDLKQLGAK